MNLLLKQVYGTNTQLSITHFTLFHCLQLTLYQTRKYRNYTSAEQTIRWHLWHWIKDTKRTEMKQFWLKKKNNCFYQYSPDKMMFLIKKKKKKKKKKSKNFLHIRYGYIKCLLEANIKKSVLKADNLSETKELLKVLHLVVLFNNTKN